CFADQHQERGLESVLGIVLAVEDPRADAQDEGAVPPDEVPERALVGIVDEAFQEPAVRVIAGVGWADNRANESQNRVGSRAGHVVGTSARCWVPYYFRGGDLLFSVFGEILAEVTAKPEGREPGVRT